MRLVKLLNGTEVPSDSEAWRHECEARQIANMPTLERRREHLAGVAEKRGDAEADRLRGTIAELWTGRQR